MILRSSKVFLLEEEVDIKSGRIFSPPERSWILSRGEEQKYRNDDATDEDDEMQDLLDWQREIKSPEEQRWFIRHVSRFHYEVLMTWTARPTFLAGEVKRYEGRQPAWAKGGGSST